VYGWGSIFQLSPLLIHAVDDSFKSADRPWIPTMISASAGVESKPGRVLMPLETLSVHFLSRPVHAIGDVGI
jgi:hypothetical protein